MGDVYGSPAGHLEFQYTARASYALNKAFGAPIGKAFGITVGAPAAIGVLLADTAVKAATVDVVGYSSPANGGTSFSNEVILTYDGDEAGQNATRRAVPMLEETGLQVRVLRMQGAKDPDEFIKKYGRERFEMLLNGTANPTEFQLKKSKAKYDLRSDDGRLSYIREAIEILTERGVSPTARDVYAGRLADETGVSKQAILSQLNGALQAAARRSYRKEQRDLSKEGIASDIRVPYTSSGESALGAANAARQLAVAMLQDPEQVPYVRARLDMSTVLVPEMQRALEAIFRCVDEHLPLNQTSLQQMLDEAAFQQLAHGQAYNHDIRLQRQDIDMYLDRLQTAKPISEQVKV